MKTNKKFSDFHNPFYLKNEILIHVAFWSIYFCLNVIRWGSFFDDYFYSFKSNLVEFPIHIFLVYLNLYFLLPKYIPRKPFIYILLLFIVILSFSLIRIELTFRLVTQDVWKEFGRDIPKYNINYVVEVFIGELYVLGFATAIKLIIDNILKKRKQEELEIRNYQIEIELLKSQFQPHFFLNTLNNLYALALDKSEKAPDLIVKLGDMMKYLIYQSKKDDVPIIDEITLIENYIELEKLRYGERLKINANLSGGITYKKIPPLLLFPFVECMFKNGNDDNTGEIDISFDLSVDNDFMTFFMKKKKCNHGDNTEEQKIIDLNKNGLRNTKRRLDLLYKNRYLLNISDSDCFNILTLKIPIVK